MLRLRALGLLLLALLLIIPPYDADQALALNQRKFALVIGIGPGYQSPRYRTLQAPEEDAHRMAATLQQVGFKVAEVTGAQATKSGTQRAIGALRREANSPDDLVVIYFSGHGTLIKGGDGQARPGIVPQDADPEDDLTMIQNAELGNWLNTALATKQVVLIFDSCFSAGMGGGADKRDTTPEQMSTQQVSSRLQALQQAEFAAAYFSQYVILASSQAQESSKELPGKGGLFTYFLLAGIGDGTSCPACDEGNNRLRLGEMFQWARRAVQAQVDQRPTLVDPAAQADKLAFLIPLGKPLVIPPRATAAPTSEPAVVHTPRPTAPPTSGVANPQPPAGVPQEQFQFVRIPAGTFMMGSPANEPGRYDNEVQHQVTISRPFGMQTTEVTQALWQVVMGNNPSSYKGADLPVTNVSWDEAQQFIARLNEMMRTYVYRLATEAEWEYAARAGTTAPYAGSLYAMAWYGNNSGGKTHSVGRKQPNAWGLFDMHGNVWEWVQDWFGDYSSVSVTDPTGPNTGSYRVRRGGSWDSFAGGCRSANRNDFDPGARIGNLGFRLAGSVSP